MGFSGSPLSQINASWWFSYAKLPPSVKVCKCMRVHGAFRWTGIPFRMDSYLMPSVPGTVSRFTEILTRINWLLKVSERHVERAHTMYYMHWKEKTNDKNTIDIARMCKMLKHYNSNESTYLQKNTVLFMSK